MLRGVLFLLRDVVRMLCIFSFLSFLDTLFLYIRSCDHLQTYIVLISFFMLMYVFLSPTHPFMCCFFSPFIHMLLVTCMQSIYCCFTQRCFDEFCFKVFQKYRLSKSTCHKLSSCKIFQEFVIGQILLYSISEYELSDL